MKTITIQFSRNGMKVFGDGKELLSPKTFELTIVGGEGDEIVDVHEGIDDAPDQSETEAPDKAIYFDDFDSFDAEVTNSRLTEPKKDWAVLYNVAEKQNSINLPANAQCNGNILALLVKPETGKFGKTEKPCTSCTVYAKKLFSKGRLDVRANLNSSRATKNTIWATSSVMTDPVTGLRYHYEWDIVEYVPADKGLLNTSRGMWAWQENKQSTSADRLPYNNLEKKTSLSPGSWYWNAKENGWVLSKVYPVYSNGNRLKGYPNGKLYFITNRDRNVAINSADLEWVREDGISGKGLDGNKYFVVTEREPIGGGAIGSQFLDGKTSISGWHTWSIVVDDDYIAFLCDDREYWRITNDQLYGLTIQDDITFNVIFAASLVGNLKESTEMQVDYIRFTPKEG